MMSVKSLSPKIYRSEMGIYSDILGIISDGGMQGVIASSLSRGANLSHDTLVSKCQKLVHAGLIQSIRAERRVFYNITEKGIWFLRELLQFQEMVRQINVRV